MEIQGDCFIVGNEDSLDRPLLTLLGNQVAIDDGKDLQLLQTKLSRWAAVSPYWDVFPKLVELYTSLFLVMGKPEPLRLIFLDPGVIYLGDDDNSNAASLQGLVQSIVSYLPVGKALIILVMVKQFPPQTMDQLYKSGIDISIESANSCNEEYAQQCLEQIKSHWYSLQRTMNQKVRNATEAISYFAIAFIVVPLIANIISSFWQLLLGPQLLVCMFILAFPPVICMAFRLNCSDAIRRGISAISRCDISRIALFLLGAMTVLAVVLLLACFKLFVF